MNNNWTTEELEAAVEVYIEMRRRSLNGESLIKKSYYEKLSNKFGRTIKSYEYRMQNISYVYSLMGRDWVQGLRPATNVGSRVAGEIEGIINKLENQISSNEVVFQSSVDGLRKKGSIDVPHGNSFPSKSKVVITQYSRDPKIVAWILNVADGTCECCNKKAPFVKTDNTPFLEVHHIRRLSDEGSDSVTNAIAICPNCHRELHYGRDKESLIKKIYSNVSRLIVE